MELTDIICYKQLRFYKYKTRKIILLDSTHSSLHMRNKQLRFYKYPCIPLLITTPDQITQPVDNTPGCAWLSPPNSVRFLETKLTTSVLEKEGPKQNRQIRKTDSFCWRCLGRLRFGCRWKKGTIQNKTNLAKDVYIYEYSHIYI